MCCPERQQLCTLVLCLMLNLWDAFFSLNLSFVFTAILITLGLQTAFFFRNIILKAGSIENRFRQDWQIPSWRVGGLQSSLERRNAWQECCSYFPSFWAAFSASISVGRYRRQIGKLVVNNMFFFLLNHISKKKNKSPLKIYIKRVKRKAFTHTHLP